MVKMALSSTNINLRVNVEEKRILQAQAEAKGITLSDHIKECLLRMPEIPPIVGDTLRKASKGLNLSPEFTLNSFVTALNARMVVEQTLFGRTLLNPLVLEVGGEGVFKDWDDVFAYFKQEYMKTLLSDAASVASHEEYIKKERPDLVQIRKEVKRELKEELKKKKKE